MTTTKPTYLYIHGGTKFNSHEEYLTFLTNREINIEKLLRIKWEVDFRKKLLKGGVTLPFFPQFPNAQNSQYDEWKLWFEKFLPHLNAKSIIAGKSLGAIFLLKYMSEEVLEEKVASIHLLAPAIRDTPHEPLYSFRNLGGLDRMMNNTESVHIFHSQDDPVCPYEDSTEIHEAIPGSTLHTFDGYGHFSCEEFPEYVEFVMNEFS